MKKSDKTGAHSDEPQGSDENEETQKKSEADGVLGPELAMLLKVNVASWRDLATKFVPDSVGMEMIFWSVGVQDYQRRVRLASTGKTFMLKSWSLVAVLRPRPPGYAYISLMML